MAVIDYPINSLPLPINAGMQYQEIVPTTQVVPQKGAPIIYSWTDNQSVVYSVTWDLNEFQVRGLRGFYYNNLSNGSEWFNIQLPGFTDNAGELRLQEANFNGSEFSISNSDKRRIVTAALTVRDTYRDSDVQTNAVLDELRLLDGGC